MYHSGSIPLLSSFKNLVHYAISCGWALAQAHARTGKAAAIAGYIGKSNKFKKAIGRFSVDYNKQNKKDYFTLLNAIEKGIIKMEYYLNLKFDSDCCFDINIKIMITCNLEQPKAVNITCFAVIESC